MFIVVIVHFKVLRSALPHQFGAAPGAAITGVACDAVPHELATPQRGIIDANIEEQFLSVARLETQALEWNGWKTTARRPARSPPEERRRQSALRRCGRRTSGDDEAIRSSNWVVRSIHGIHSALDVPQCWLLLCLTYDITAAGYLAVLLWRSKGHWPQNVNKKDVFGLRRNASHSNESFVRLLHKCLHHALVSAIPKKSQTIHFSEGDVFYGDAFFTEIPRLRSVAHLFGATESNVVVVDEKVWPEQTNRPIPLLLSKLAVWDIRGWPQFRPSSEVKT